MDQFANIPKRLDVLGASSFRAKFRLAPKERTQLETKGMTVIQQHATDIIGRRLAPAQPAKDGKQTPYRGHPVFIAQHATATCCRTCLEKWHHITKGHELTGQEQRYVVEVIISWLRRQQ